MPGKEIDIVQRARVVALRECGKTYREIGEIVGLSHTTCRYIVKRHTDTGTITSRPRPGRPKKLAEREREAIVEEISNDPFKSAANIASHVEEIGGPSVSAQTIRNVLHSEGIYGRTARRKPLISERNRLKRLAFANEYINKPLSFWHSVIFSDESKFNLFGSDGRQYVWRKANTALN